MSASDDVALSFGDPEAAKSASSKIKHPVALFFHLLFRVLALLVYIVTNFVYHDEYMGIFIAIVILLAMDFWVVKNVTGRLLVGLRWWNKVEDDGSSSWQFESKKRNVSRTESLTFWVGLVLCPACWAVFIFTSFIRFSLMWMLIPIVGVTLTGANLVGYVKCRKDAGTKIRNMAGQFISKQIVKQAMAATQVQ